MKWLRRLLGSLLILLVTVAVIVVGGYYWLTTSLPDFDGTVEIDGVSAPVEIYRDPLGIPHIFAVTDDDAYFALGYVHAQDRLWQMEMNRRVGQGRVAEIAGERALGIDKLVRTLGFYRSAERIVERMAPDARAVLDAYATGVNAFLDTRSGALPPEFLVTGVDPEPWRPADSVVWGKLMTLQLSGNWLKERLRLLFNKRLSPEQLEQLWPDNVDSEPTTLSSLWPLYRRIADLAGPQELPAPSDAAGLSNEWVVDGSRTASGKPLLANDPHLAYQAPNLWYLARLETPDMSLIGATVPGVPIVLLGHNGNIAWGLSTTNSDVSDLFIERLAPDDSGMYLTPEGPVQFMTREEVISVDESENVVLKVRETRHGPVVSDLWADQGLPLEKGHVLALQAAFLGDDLTAQAMVRFNRATDWQQVMAALRDYAVPQQNFVYADTAGNIGFIAPGLVPIRRQGDGWMPVPGWTGAYDWVGFVPYEGLPRAFNPAEGRIVNANNAVVPPTYPYFLGRDWDVPYRAERIDEMLDEGGPYDANFFADIQADNLSGAARALLPIMLGSKPVSQRAADARSFLEAWDFAMFRDQPEPLIFSAWLRELNRALFADELGDLFKQYWNLRAEVVLNVLTRDHAWCDDVSTAETESCDSRVALALDRATADLTAKYGDSPRGWLWAFAHPATFKSRVFGTIPFIGNIANLQIAADGGAYTINRNASSVANDKAPFAAVHGAGYRAIYDLSDLSKSMFIQATGQSGNLLSPYYDSFLEPWRNFRYLRISGDRELLASSALGVLTLLPE